MYTQRKHSLFLLGDSTLFPDLSTTSIKSLENLSEKYFVKEKIP